MKLVFAKTPSSDFKCLIWCTRLHVEGSDSYNLTRIRKPNSSISWSIKSERMKELQKWPRRYGKWSFRWTSSTEWYKLMLVQLRGTRSTNASVNPRSSHQLMWRVKSRSAVDQFRLREVNVVFPSEQRRGASVWLCMTANVGASYLEKICWQIFLDADNWQWRFVVVRQEC